MIGLIVIGIYLLIGTGTWIALLCGRRPMDLVDQMIVFLVWPAVCLSLLLDFSADLCPRLRSIQDRIFDYLKKE